MGAVDGDGAVQQHAPEPVPTHGKGVGRFAAAAGALDAAVAHVFAARVLARGASSEAELRRDCEDVGEERQPGPFGQWARWVAAGGQL